MAGCGWLWLVVVGCGCVDGKACVSGADGAVSYGGTDYSRRGCAGGCVDEVVVVAVLMAIVLVVLVVIVSWFKWVRQRYGLSGAFEQCKISALQML